MLKSRYFKISAKYPIIIMNKIYTPTANSFFSGVGGMDIGFMQAGIEINQSLDLDIEAIEGMRSNPHYFNHAIIHKDVKDVKALDQLKADIIIGTYPCQKYSTIADIHGTRTGEDLYLHFFRQVALNQPEAYVLENVPGMKKFPVVMEAMSKLPNYYINIFCPVDALNWLPQSRKRLILVGTKKPFSMSAPTKSGSVKLKDIIEKNPLYEMPDYVISRINGKYRDKPIYVNPNDLNAYAPTCVAHYSKDLGTRLVIDKKAKYGARPFSIREYARLQGFPDDYFFAEKRSSYRLIGNAVPCHMARWIGSELMKYFN